MAGGGALILRRAYASGYRSGRLFGPGRAVHAGHSRADRCRWDPLRRRRRADPGLRRPDAAGPSCPRRTRVGRWSGIGRLTRSGSETSSRVGPGTSPPWAPHEPAWVRRSRPRRSRTVTVTGSCSSAIRTASRPRPSTPATTASPSTATTRPPGSASRRCACLVDRPSLCVTALVG